MEQIHEGKVVKAGGGGHTGLWPVFLGNGSQRRLGGEGTTGGRTRSLSQEPADEAEAGLVMAEEMGEQISQLRQKTGLPMWLPACGHPSLTNASDYTSQRRLAACSPKGCKESDTIERDLEHTHTSQKPGHSNSFLVASQWTPRWPEVLPQGRR